MFVQILKAIPSMILRFIDFVCRCITMFFILFYSFVLS